MWEETVVELPALLRPRLLPPRGGIVATDRHSTWMGLGAIDPGSIQADGGGMALRQGIIGLTTRARRASLTSGEHCAPGNGASAG